VHGRAESKQNICNSCIKNTNKISSSGQYSTTSVENLNENGELIIESLKSILPFKKCLTSVLQLKYKDFPVCRIAYFSFAITRKIKKDHVLNDIQIEDYIESVIDIMILIDSFENVVKTYIPNYIIYIGENYSHNLLAKLFFSKYGSICLNFELQHYTDSKLGRARLSSSALGIGPKMFCNFSDIPPLYDNISAFKTYRILATFKKRVDGKSHNAYTSLSKNKASVAYDNFISKFKRIHVFFPSSEDEIDPYLVTHSIINDTINKYNNNGFNSQLSFMKYFLSKIINYKDIGFVIRLHPRMAVNKRDLFESNEHFLYKELLKNKGNIDNLHIIYGDNKISSTYVMKKADMVITAWSFIGTEAMVSGTPVVAIFPEFMSSPIKQLTNQPSSKYDLDKSIFEVSRYGVCDNVKLLSWLCCAFEDNFFTIMVYRPGGYFGKIYSVLLNVITALKMYDVIASLHNFIFLRSVEKSLEIIYTQPVKYSKFTIVHKKISVKLLMRYRYKLNCTIKKLDSTNVKP
jgi:hypothetical protein